MTPDEHAHVQQLEAAVKRYRSRIVKLKAALAQAQRLCQVALPQFDWGRSALDAEAIRLLNEVPGEISAALQREGDLDKP